MNEIDAQRNGYVKWAVDSKHGLRAPELQLVRADLIAKFMVLSRVPSSRISWMTIIGAAIVVRPGDHTHAVAEIIEGIERQIAKRCRSKLPGMRLRGAHEIDVMARSALRCAPHKRALISALGVDVDAIEPDQRVLVVHLHCVIDRADHSADKVSQHFRAAFPGSYRTMAKPLESDKNVGDNLTQLAKYCTKFKVAYSDSWCDRKTRYAGRYEDEWVDTIAFTIQGIGLDRIVFSYGGA